VTANNNMGAAELLRKYLESPAVDRVLSAARFDHQ
jgi:hypothetical protein